jgi:hypothetical protein
MRLAIPGEDAAVEIPRPGLGFFQVTRLATASESFSAKTLRPFEPSLER